MKLTENSTSNASNQDGSFPCTIYTTSCKCSNNIIGSENKIILPQNQQKKNLIYLSSLPRIFVAVKVAIVKADAIPTNGPVKWIYLPIVGKYP